MTQPLPPLTGDISAFAALIGLTVISATTTRVEAELAVRPDLLNRNGVLHGGAIMALADILGGLGTFTAIRPDQVTTTVESKTNFFRPLLLGERVRAISEPLHQGRKTQVWQTSVLREDGKLAAQVTQTQMVLER
ncbi:PaaI family thioesterase [Pseudogemmobacter bohemicus]|uniref:PaaI family thioesterase n=1 Tax=Pseudogemmobacter bohemicus TaxID=2250708 RepID=UPI000DD37BF0|nr:PaaI family thioesterase [Pseudogemmobacter bohemicus]